MYVLVFWTEYKTTSIVEEKNLYADAPEGEVVFVKYKDGEKYKAKIVKKSYDKGYLNRLRVNEDGELIKPKSKFTEKRAVFQKYEIDRKRKAQDKSKTVFSHLAANKIGNSNSIFSDTSSENEENEIQRKRKQEESEAESSTEENAHKIKRTKEKSDREESENETRKGQQLETQRARELERQRTEQERLREQELRKEQERQREKERKKDRREQKKEQIRQLLEELKDETATESEDKEDDLDTVEAEREIEIDEQDPMENQRRKETQEENLVLSGHMPGNGKIQLCKLYNAWIDKADISYFQRWLESPRELTRQLLKNLVGVENLKRMCARGKSRTNTRAIPEDIMKAVEYYVNKRCTSRFKPLDFTNVVNMMIGTLRNPKKNI